MVIPVYNYYNIRSLGFVREEVSSTEFAMGELAPKDGSDRNLGRYV